MDDRGRIWEKDEKSEVLKNLETEGFIKKADELMNRVSMMPISQDEKDELLKMNRKQRREWFKKNKGR